MKSLPMYKFREKAIPLCSGESRLGLDHKNPDPDTDTHTYNEELPWEKHLGPPRQSLHLQNYKESRLFIPYPNLRCTSVQMVFAPMPFLLKCLMSAWSHFSVTSGCLCCHKHFSKICLGRESFLMTKLNAYHPYLWSWSSLCTRTLKTVIYFSYVSIIEIGTYKRAYYDDFINSNHETRLKIMANYFFTIITRRKRLSPLMTFTDFLFHTFIQWINGSNKYTAFW